MEYSVPIQELKRHSENRRG